ncbi:MAG: basic rane protein [Thermoleophilales bacterium]|jgi:basic membrane protein A|nr:basic rane protein [Thermoleophilales bacterium]
MRLTRFSSLLCVLLLAVGLAACGSDSKSSGGSSGDGAAADSGAKKKVKVGALFPGRVNDKAFNQTGYEGLKEAEQEFGLEVSYRESVPQPEYESTMRDYAQRGYDLVLGYGFQFADAAAVVAKDFPKVKFIVNPGAAAQPPNLAGTNNDEWQSGYVAGAAAGLITKTNVVAYMGGVPIPPLVQTGNAFREGVKSTNPKAKVIVTHTGTFDDVAKGKQTGLSLIDQGADIIMGNANAVGVAALEAAASRGKFGIGAQFDQTSVAPDSVLGSAVVRQNVSVKKGIELVVNGTFEPKLYIYGLKDDSTDFVWNPKFEQQFPEAAAAADKAREDILAGKIKPPSIKP